MINPSIVTDWNIDYFDTPYLYNRIKRLMGTKRQIDYHQLVNVHWNTYQTKILHDSSILLRLYISIQKL